VDPAHLQDSEKPPTADLRGTAWVVHARLIAAKEQPNYPASLVVRYDRHFSVQDGVLVRRGEIPTDGDDVHNPKNLREEVIVRQPLAAAVVPAPLGNTNPLAVAKSIDDLVVTYESCLAKLGAASKPKSARTLMWLHLPKCGTSLGTVVHGYLCQEEETPHLNPGFGQKGNKGKRNCDYCELEQMNKQGTPYWDGKIRQLVPQDPEIRKFCDWNVGYKGWFFGHNPLRAGTFTQKEKEIPDVVTLFRDPRRRAVSAWNHAKHTHHLGTNDAETRFPHSRENLEKETQSLKAFATHMHVKSCQTKMLLGGQCGMFHNITPTMFQNAKKYVKMLAFVGLTDHYNASVCLFHDMLGGVPQPHMFMNARPAAAHRESHKLRNLPGGGTQEKPTAWRTLSPLDDPMDFELFEHAQDIFIARLREHRYLI
jgi:hypothetical protein